MTEFGEGPRWGPASGATPRQLVMLLHGVGADGFDLIDLAPGWGEALPDALFVAPHAPEPCDMAPYGRQWFSLQDRSPARMQFGVAVGAATLGGWLDAELLRFGLTRAQTALMGFSQGAMTALFAGLRQPGGCAAVLAYSGALIAPESLAGERRGNASVLLVHGEADSVVPVQASRQAEASLRAAGIAVEAAYRPGLDHGIDDFGIALGAAALRHAFAA